MCRELTRQGQDAEWEEDQKASVDIGHNLHCRGPAGTQCSTLCQKVHKVLVSFSTQACQFMESQLNDFTVEDLTLEVRTAEKAG